MAGFLYFAPGRPVISRENAGELGLASVFDGETVQSVGPIAGPEGKTGAIAGARAERIAYHPDVQEWRKGHRGDFWIGWWKDAPPCGVDLERARRIPGHEIAIGKAAWTVPVIRAWRRPAGLPQRIDLDENGKWVGAPLSEFDHIVAAAAWASFSSWATIRLKTSARRLPSPARFITICPVSFPPKDR